MALTQEQTANEIVTFLRKKDYTYVKVLGHGACGETVLLQDKTIDVNFVCKKYSPYAEEHRAKLFENFLREIRLLHDVYHHNVVRVFNYYVYPDSLTGYILMEYVEGKDIEDMLKESPDAINDIFRQVIDGFAYLEDANILHRDIRPQNILVRTDGRVKIIDLGFGKRIQYSEDFGKSVSLNLWCEPPDEFSRKTYDFSTEVYFVGRLFEKIIRENSIDSFKHATVLAKMCHKNPDNRFQRFSDVIKQLGTELTEELSFSAAETQAYRDFSQCLSAQVTKIETGAKYKNDLDVIRTQLGEIFRKCMLEEAVPDCRPIVRCFVDGTWYYLKADFPTRVLRGFVTLLKSANLEKQRVALANLQTRLDAINRYAKPDPKKAGDVPF